MPRQKNMKDKKRTVFAAYDEDETCVCVGYIEDLMKFIGCNANKIYCAVCRNSRVQGKYYIYIIEEGRKRKERKECKDE